MTDATFTPEALLSFDRGRLSQRHSTWTVAGAGAVTLGVLVGSLILDHRATAPRVDAIPLGTARLTAAFRTPAAKPIPDLADPDVQRPAKALDLAPTVPAIVPPKTETAMLEPGFARGPSPATLADSGPLAPRFTGAAPTPAEATAAPAPAGITMIVPLPEAPHDAAPVPMPGPAAMPQVEAPQAGAVPMPGPAAAPQVEASQPGAVPLPAPRPAFRWAAPEQYRAARRQVAGNTDTAPTPAPATAVPADNRSFLDRFFGALKPSNGPVLAYASPEDGLFSRSAAGPTGPAYAHDHYTAVYDISAHTVYMPDGSKLEAHSGLGGMMDDPRHVTARNTGPTPPHLYDLSLRESLFHGVQALRLSPVGGGGVYGRDGLLAHTYMLGPNGQSNGCVSFRDYQAFLRAYQNGQVKRLAVVTGLG